MMTVTLMSNSTKFDIKILMHFQWWTITSRVLVDRQYDAVTSYLSVVIGHVRAVICDRSTIACVEDAVLLHFLCLLLVLLLLKKSNVVPRCLLYKFQWSGNR